MDCALLYVMRHSLSCRLSTGFEGLHITKMTSVHSGNKILGYLLQMSSPSQYLFCKVPPLVNSLDRLQYLAGNRIPNYYVHTYLDVLLNLILYVISISTVVKFSRLLWIGNN